MYLEHLLFLEGKRSVVDIRVINLFILENGGNSFFKQHEFNEKFLIDHRVNLDVISHFGLLLGTHSRGR